MRNRGTLQANDLLDIVDFIKNEEKYTVRIKELQDLEASLQTKMKIVNSLEEVEAMKEKNQIISEKLAQDRIKLEQEFEDRKILQKRDEDERYAKISKRESELRHMKEDINDANDILRQGQDLLGEIQRKYGLDRQDLDRRLNEVEKTEFKWREKIVQLNKLLGL